MSSRTDATAALVAVALVVCLLGGGASVGSAHLDHDDSTPSEPLEPDEVPPWFTPAVGGLGLAVGGAAVGAVVSGRASKRVGWGGVVVAAALLSVAGAADPAWF
ncbi:MULTISPECIES: hypothetical protein [Haloferax]|uniref:Uncharacterized protein n=1 Tax=Haloferax sp. Atlit-48N TaxID=2077198 RepID=A0ACD5I1L0_9EURY|nr:MULTISPECIES: hypothetical protein [Haloferax]MBC9988396.1 hypothetical protein [Haloferax sp. AS1]RDZ30909.1 hypothetical protein DEQ67_11910 [Haloferax sp. Atlit-48N]RDZ34086.1 hypothetical protein C5B88_15765 [Haloferax sp. Atlit-24N]RDZ38459.1 hypothetical protein C5B89_13800 [Haloferax sp. Atlit-47N]RLM36210.1 hypothetical protein DVK03_15665 [Haloferax sp. Atlit-109R]